MFDFKFGVNDKEAAEVLEVTTRNYRDTIRRAMSITAQMVGAETKRNIEAGETKPYFQRRKAGLIKGYYRLTKLRYNWKGEDTIVAQTQTKNTRQTEMVSAIEAGGRYQQFVKTPFERRRTKAFGRPVNPYVETVRGSVYGKHIDGGEKRAFLRYRTENHAAQYMVRAAAQLGDRAGIPIARGLQILINEKRAATRAELTAGTAA